MVAVLAVVAIGVLFLVEFSGGARTGPSSECVRLQKDLSDNLKAGDDEATVKAFISRRGWLVEYDQFLEGYNFRVPVGGGGPTEHHFVIVQIRIKDGAVAEIKVEDFFRTL